MTPGSNRNADLHLADILSHDVETALPDELLSEVAEDFGDRQALVREFDHAFARAVAQDRKRRVGEWLKARAAPARALFMRPGSAIAAAVFVCLIGGALYLNGGALKGVPSIDDNHRSAQSKAAELVAGRADTPGTPPAPTNMPTSQDYAAALQSYERAAAAGDTAAMRSIAVLYASGSGVAQDFAQARKWYEKAAAAGDSDAMREIGHLYFNGLGVAQDRVRARAWYDKAVLTSKDLEKSQAHPGGDTAAAQAQPTWNPKMGRMLAVFSGHTRAVERCAFSPGGRRLVTAAHGSLRVWDVRGGYPVAEIQGPPSPVAAVRFGLDDHEIFAAFGVTVTHVSDRGSLTMTFQSFPSKVLDVAPTSGGLYVITGAEGISAKLFMDGKETVSLQGHTAGVAEAAFSADGKLVLTTSNDKTSIWSTESGRRVAVFNGPHGSIAAISPDGRRLLTAGREDPKAQLWDVASSATIAALNGHTAPLTGAAFSSDGQQVITASEDGTARVWSAESGQGIAILKGHDGAVTSVAFSPDGSLAATTSADMTARLWQVRPKQR